VSPADPASRQLAILGANFLIYNWLYGILNYVMPHEYLISKSWLWQLYFQEISLAKIPCSVIITQLLRSAMKGFGEWERTHSSTSDEANNARQ